MQMGNTAEPGLMTLYGLRVSMFFQIAGMAYGLCTSLPSWITGFESRCPLHFKT